MPENLRLIGLPAYSPELNPEEHVWDEVREKAFPDLVLDRMDRVMERLQGELSALAAAPNRVRSLTAWPWIVSLNVRANENHTSVPMLRPLSPALSARH